MDYENKIVLYGSRTLHIALAGLCFVAIASVFFI